MRPIDAAYERGDQSFASGLARFWVEKSRELRNDITDRFPFNQNSTVDADVEVLTSWLDPLEGRFGSEVLSIYRLAMACGAEPCVELPPGMQSSVERLIAIQHTLFDEKGEPQTLKFQIDPVPFTSQELLPKRAVLKLGESRYDYFNTAPRPLNVVVPWNEAYVATLSVELAGAEASDELASPLSTRKSPWAFPRLLAAARSAIDGRYAWELDATLHGIRQGTVGVSYDVCRDIGRCNGLLERVFDWP
jgi:type VI protein secretion system component VasK